MTPRIRALRTPPIGFAHRGARAHAQENTLESFQLALDMGATGIESDVWVTRDGMAVLDHDGVVGPRLRRRPIAAVDRADLPPHIPTIEELFARCGDDFELSLDVKDPAAASATLDALDAVSNATGRNVASRTWLCHPDWEVVATWRERWSHVRLVDSTRLHLMKAGPERRAAQLSSAGIDAVNLLWSDWTGGLATLFHRFDVFCLGWNAQLDRVLRELIDLGIDGVYSDHVDRLMVAIDGAYPPS